MRSSFFSGLLLLVVLVFCLPARGFSQGYTSQGILQLVELKYGVDTDTMLICSSYMIDGVAFEGIVLEQELMKHTEGSIGLVEFWEPEPADGQKNCEWVIWISTRDSQTEAEKEALLLQINTYYKASVPDLTDAGFKCQLCKPLTIDNVLYQHKEVKPALSNLTAKDIAFIAWYGRPVNPEVFGSGAANGLIEIQLKQGSGLRGAGARK